MMRDKGVFGNDADTFSLERWLQPDGNRLRTMEHTVELVFGYGKWGCLGKPIALLDLNKMFVEVCPHDR